MMTEEDKKELFEIVLDSVNRRGREVTEKRIWDAHMGSPDGWVVSMENMHLFRRYRNSVSGNPIHMVDAALAYHRSEWEKV